MGPLSKSFDPLSSGGYVAGIVEGKRTVNIVAQRDCDFFKRDALRFDVSIFMQ